MAEQAKTDRGLPLIQKLAKIRKLVDIVAKDMSGYGYKYADINEILAKVKTGMERYGVSLIPKIVPNTATVQQNVVVEKKIDKTGKEVEKVTTEMLVQSQMVFVWVNDDNVNDVVEVPWFLVGAQSDPSQAFGSALTYCTRYFMLDYFQIAQDNDVDAYRSKQKEAAQAEDVETAAAIIKLLDTEIRTFIGSNPDAAPEVKKLCARFAKDGKYTAIKEPALAGKLLEEFREQFINTNEEDS